MTPMIDVVFLLLIFFVCASIGQIPESLMPTPLNSGSTDSTEQADIPKPQLEVWVKLRRVDAPDESFTRAEVDEELYEDWTELRTTLRALAAMAPEIPVILDIGPAVPVGDLVDIYDTCRAAGFDSVKFAASPQNAAG
jgi:biopolymer transport protein ExbD